MWKKIAKFKSQGFDTLRAIVGVMDDSGHFPSTMKLAGAGGGTSLETFLGMKKSSISLFNTIPVLGERIFEPKYAFTIVVMEMAFLSRSIHINDLYHDHEFDSTYQDN